MLFSHTSALLVNLSSCVVYSFYAFTDLWPDRMGQSLCYSFTGLCTIISSEYGLIVSIVYSQYIAIATHRNTHSTAQHKHTHVCAMCYIGKTILTLLTDIRKKKRNKNPHKRQVVAHSNGTMMCSILYLEKMKDVSMCLWMVTIRNERMCIINWWCAGHFSYNRKQPYRYK